MLMVWLLCEIGTDQNKGESSDGGKLQWDNLQRTTEEELLHMFDTGVFDNSNVWEAMGRHYVLA